MSTEPVRYVLIPIVLAAFAAAGQAFIDGATTRGIVVAVIGALVLAAQEYARAQVTPTASAPRARRALDDRGVSDVGLLMLLVGLVVGVLVGVYLL